MIQSQSYHDGGDSVGGTDTTSFKVMGNRYNGIRAKQKW